jgi:hypothetical protein
MIRKAVIDSGPLFSALTLRFAFAEEELGRSARLDSGLEEPLLTKTAQLQFLNLMRSIPDKLTTSHAIAELHHLQRSRLKFYGPILETFWQTSINQLRLWNLDERPSGCSKPLRTWRPQSRRAVWWILASFSWRA